MQSASLSRITSSEMAAVFQSACQAGLMDEPHSAVIFYDLTRLKARFDALKKSFPTGTLHAVAIKANPLLRILNRFADWNAGAEAASLPEMHLALRAGFAPAHIVFDSPCKTPAEICFALEKGIYLNVDNLAELARVATLRETVASNSCIGIRLNPQIGLGRIAMTSVAGEYSKFGIPLKPYRPELLAAFARYSWLRGLHVHIGSQGCSPELLIKGIGLVYEFALEVNRQAGYPQINHFDIGGGLPVAYRATDTDYTMADYAADLAGSCPELFSGHFRLLTEFGRYLQANCGWTVSRVEYVKPAAELSTIIIHVGADLLLRRCYQPKDWHHDLTVLDAAGRLKAGSVAPYAIAGPLCFSGDMIARRVELPEVCAGDFLAIHDTGAYTLGMWSRYNSRQVPRVIGYEGGNGLPEFSILKERETIDDVLNFWM